jgi:ATP-dependent Clp protease ATP-binding subunit ClpC
MAMDYTDKAKEVLEYAHSFANMAGSRQVCTEHILAGLTKIENSMACTVLNQNGVTFEAVTEMLSSGMMSGSSDSFPTLDGAGEYSQKARQALRKSSTRSSAASEEIRRTIQVLSRRTKNNPVLIGEPGVGKTAIVEGLAERIVAGRRAFDHQGQGHHGA